MTPTPVRARQILPGAVIALGLAVLPTQASARVSFKTAGAAAPAAACSEPPTTQAFAAFNDLASYGLAPGGDFEVGSASWVLRNAAVVDGNESRGVLSGNRSVLLGVSRAGGAAEITSPEFCVTKDHPTFRAMVRSVGTSAARSGYGATIQYRLVTKLDKNYLDVVGVQLASAQWAPTAINELATAIPNGAFSKGVLVRIKYYLPANNVQAGGAIQLDDVLVDPLRRS